MLNVTACKFGLCVGNDWRLNFSFNFDRSAGVEVHLRGSLVWTAELGLLID